MNNKIKLYSTLSQEKEDFSPIHPGKVGMYTCGPTVYNYAHIGNLRSYVFADVLRRTLTYAGLKVKQIINITDIGHLSSDADSGEDKMTKGLLREGKELNLKNMRVMAEFYAQKFKDDIDKLNVQAPYGFYYASDYIKEDISLIKKLEKKGYSYITSDGVYFDTAKMPDYGVLWGGLRIEDNNKSRISENNEKKHPADFALWKFNSGVGFESPWGRGFPGWHIECSAMSMKFLGQQFDIHTGGIDHIPTHHTNEIAQSECATGKKPFVKFWMHHEHVDIGSEKMAKSGENFLRLQSLIDKGLNPITYRFWLLMANYHTKMNFNWDALTGAETALKRLYSLYNELGRGKGKVNQEYQERFKERLFDDLDTPRALSLLWDLIKDENISNADKKTTILDFDKVLGLNFKNVRTEIVPSNVLNLVKQREHARLKKNFKISDELRNKINSLGYEVKDSSTGSKVIKI